MDPWSVHVKYSNPTPIFPRNSFLDNKLSYCNLSKLDYGGRVFEIRYSSRKSSFSVQSMAKNNSSSSGNGDRSNTGGNGPKGNNNSEGNKSNNHASQRPHHITKDWREFRATLFAHEQVESVELATQGQDGSCKEPKPLGLKWAHPISSPETGSVLVATEVLDGYLDFERTVVLLLKYGSRHPQERLVGVVLNRPVHKKIKHMKTNNPDLATTFGDCSLHIGGPLETSIFLLKTAGNPKIPGIEEVIPGLYFGGWDSLDEAMSLVKKGVIKQEDFRFFVGYAGWEVDQLREEIESKKFWHVAACSKNLMYDDGLSEGLWEETLQLMGGHYSELSQKPKQDL